MFHIARPANRARRVSRQFQPAGSDYTVHSCLESRAMVTVAFYYTPGVAYGDAMAQATSTVAPAPYTTGDTQNSSSGDSGAGASVSSQLTNTILATETYDNDYNLTVITDMTGTEDGIASTTVYGPADTPDSSAFEVSVVTTLTNLDSETAYGGPFSAAPEMNQNSSVATLAPYSFTPVNVTPTGNAPIPTGTTVTATFTLTVTPPAANFYAYTSINFTSTHLSVNLQEGGLTVTDPSTNTTLYSNSDFLVNGGGTYSVSVTDPIAATETVGPYTSQVYSGPNGVTLTNQTAASTPSLTWSFGLSIDNPGPY